GDLQKIGEVAGNLQYPARVTFKGHSGFGGRPSDELERFGARKRPQKNVGKDVKNRGVRDELSVTQLLKIARGAGHVSHVVVVGNRAKKRIELQVKRLIGCNRIELIEQNNELAPVAAKGFEHPAQRVKRRLQLCKRLVSGFLGEQCEQLIEKLGKREPSFLL